MFIAWRAGCRFVSGPPSGRGRVRRDEGGHVQGILPFTISEVQTLTRAEPELDPEMLAGLPGVLAVRQVNARQLVATVDEAATLTPRIMDALRAGGVEVEEMEERQPTFDEVFTLLVERQRAARPPEPQETTPA